ncbi:MAG: nucleotidyltransferase domain-containing protein, partial [Thermodesulfovibrionales bacterium]
MDLNRIKSIFADYPEIKLVYLFGSRAKGIAGQLSDYDFAVYCDGKDKYRIYEI